MGFDPTYESFKIELEKYHTKTRYTIFFVLAAILLIIALYLAINAVFLGQSGSWTNYINAFFTSTGFAFVEGWAFHKWHTFNFEGHELRVHGGCHAIIVKRGFRETTVHDFGTINSCDCVQELPILVFPLGRPLAFHMPPSNHFLSGSYDRKKRCFTLEETGFKFVGTLTELIQLVRSYPNIKYLDVPQLLLDKIAFARVARENLEQQDRLLKSYEEATRLLLVIPKAIEECLNGTRFHATEEGRKLIEAQMKALEQIFKTLPDSSNVQALGMKLERLKETLFKKSPANRLAAPPTGN